MCMTEPISATTLAAATPTTATTTDKKMSKSVGFAKKVSTIVATVELEDPSVLWYSKLDLSEFKHKAKHLSDHLRQSQPLLAQEIEEAYETTRQKDVEATGSLLPHWSKLGSSRRGLERFVLSKQQRRDQAQEVKASRSVVLNLQCLFKRNPMAAQMADTHAEMMRQQYFEFAKPAQLLAQVYGNADAETVLPYLRDEEDVEEDLFEEDDLSDEDDTRSQHSVTSKESRDSISLKKGKKLKRRKSGTDMARKGRSKEKLTSKERPSLKTKSGKSRGKSPLRRSQSLVSDYGLVGTARPV